MTDTIQLGELEMDIFKLSNQDRSFLVLIISHLKEEYFNSSMFSKIFKIYKLFFEKFNKIPTKNILEDQLLKMGEEKSNIAAYTHRIFDTQPVDITEKGYITNEVIRFGRQARMKSAIIKSIDLLEKDDFEGITAEVRDALLFNLDAKMGYDLYDVDARYKSLKESLDNKVSSGYAQIDKVLNGGWSKKELIAVLGSPGIGKSVFLPNFGFKALLNGLNVVHYSMEMSEDRLGMRYDAIASSINIKKLTDHPDEIKKKYDTIKKVTSTHLKLKEFPTSMASILDIEAHLEQLKLYEDFSPDMVIVDYGDIMRSTRKTNNLYEEQGWIFRELRGLAVKNNIIIITATQANRSSLDGEGGTKEIVGIENTADSMEKARIIDALFSITQKRQEKDQGKISLWVAKNRNGESNVMLEFAINYSNMQIKEMLIGASNTSSVGADPLDNLLTDE